MGYSHLWSSDIFPSGEMSGSSSSPLPLAFCPFRSPFSQDTHFVSPWTFGRIDDIKFNPLPLPQSAEALSLNGAVVDEDVRPVVAGDEPVAFLLVEPLDCAFELRHCDRTSFGRFFCAAVRNASPASGSPVQQRHISDPASPLV